jgi:hypothetical protein
LCTLFSAWASEAGLDLPAPDSAGIEVVEVDPLLAESAAAFCEVAPEAPHASELGHLYDAP